MHGPRAWEMLMMVGLLSSLFLILITYFIDRRERILSQKESKGLHTTFKIFLVIAAIAGLILVQPAWLGTTSINDPKAWINPAGSMDYKYVALFTLVLIGVAILMIDAIMLGDVREAEWGKLSRTSRISGIMAGIIGMWIVVVMGYVRESARSPWLIFKTIPVPGGQKYPTPIPVSRIFIVWAIITIAAVLVFWFTSKVTAHHPEKAEKV